MEIERSERSKDYRKVLTPNKFKKFLETTGNNWFGVASACGCPVASYLKSLFPYAEIIVKSDTCEVEFVNERRKLINLDFELPDWFEKYVYLVDSEFKVTIRTKDAIKLCDRIKFVKNTGIAEIIH